MKFGQILVRDLKKNALLPEKIRNTFSDGLIKKGSKLKIEIHQNPIGNSKYLSPTYIVNQVIKYWGIYKCNLNPFWILLLPIPFWVFDWCWVAVTKYNWLPAFFFWNQIVWTSTVHSTFRLYKVLRKPNFLINKTN